MLFRSAAYEGETAQDRLNPVAAYEGETAQDRLNPIAAYEGETAQAHLSLLQPCCDSSGPQTTVSLQYPLYQYPLATDVVRF